MLAKIWRDRNPHLPLVGLQTGADTLEIRLENSQKAKINSSIWPRYSTPWHMPKGLNTLLHRYPLMFIAAKLKIARRWKQPNRPSADEQIMKMWYVYSMGYYSSVEIREIQQLMDRPGMYYIVKQPKSRKTNAECSVSSVTPSSKYWDVSIWPGVTTEIRTVKEIPWQQRRSRGENSRWLWHEGWDRTWTGDRGGKMRNKRRNGINNTKKVWKRQGIIIILLFYTYQKLYEIHASVIYTEQTQICFSH